MPKVMTKAVHVACTCLILVAGMPHLDGARQMAAAWPPWLRSGGATLGHPVQPFVIAMLDPKFLEDLSARISAALAATPAAEVEKNLRALLTAAFARLDLVTREDFEVQKDLLTRAQSRLATLEARLAELEGRRKT
jgi:BMFP domain-containing protein YqiC